MDFIENETRDSAQLYDLLSLSEFNRQTLKDRIEKWGGTVRIFVHPYFIESSYPEQSHKDFPGHEKTGRALELLVKNGSDRTPPIFLFEESKRVIQTNDRLKGILNQPIYTVATETSDIKLENKDWDYQKLKDLLATLGVKRLIVAGQTLGVFPDTLVDKGSLVIPENFGFEDLAPWLNGCVGDVINNLQDSRFKIEISNFNLPDSKKNLRNAFK